MSKQILQFCVVLSTFVVIVHGSTIKQTRTNPNAGLNIFELAEFHGYPLEAHEVETEDGYILGVHRIPHGKQNANETNKPAIFLMHGLLSCSADWINIGPEKSLAYKLADLGFDVWMGNARGNAESRRHKLFNPNTNKTDFWSFSWHEIGYYDLPAMIDYILELTNQEKLQYVGFSQGTTSFMVMASARPEYNDKIILSTLLSAAAELSNIKNPILRPLTPYMDTVYKLANAFGIYELLPRSKFMEYLGLTLCDDGKPTQELCKIVLFAIAGYDREQLDGGLLPVITTNTPAGSSLKQLVHYFQVIKDGFKLFDYQNEELNIQKYGVGEPPKYDLKKITAPVAIYYGINDWLVSEVDVKLTASQIANVVYLKEVEHSAWTHLDFVWALDVADIVYKDVINVITKYNN